MNRIPPPPERPEVDSYHVAEISVCVTESKAGGGPSQVFTFNYTRGMVPYIVRSHNLKSVLEILVPDPKYSDNQTHADGPESFFFDNARIVWVRQKLWDPAIHEATEEDTDGDDTGRESEGESKEALDETRSVLLHATRDDIWPERDTRLHSLCARLIRWSRDKGWTQ